MAGYRHILPPSSLCSSTPLVNEGGKEWNDKLQFKVEKYIMAWYNEYDIEMKEINYAA